ncbi:hypothetical protein ACFWG6_30770 [Streptomyces erythrochromogenes]|uniref:hypothetical protein n=1 Tax=Streptomyces erythrochromogenes TaxID=285574 RepID=UPI00362A06FB
MMQDWIQMDRAWLDDLGLRLEERRRRIATDGLQPDAYPPFPACPECHAVPEVIRRASDDHFEIFTSGAVVTRFEPCRHTFRVDPPSPDRDRAATS